MGDDNEWPRFRRVNCHYESVRGIQPIYVIVYRIVINTFVNDTIAYMVEKIYFKH